MLLYLIYLVTFYKTISSKRQTVTICSVYLQHPMFMMASIVYLVFGLALTSMCINVVQVRIYGVTLVSNFLFEPD